MGKMSMQELIRSGRVMDFLPSAAAAAAAARPSSSESMHSYSSHFQPTAPRVKIHAPRNHGNTEFPKCWT